MIKHKSLRVQTSLDVYIHGGQERHENGRGINMMRPYNVSKKKSLFLNNLDKKNLIRLPVFYLSKLERL